MTVIGMSSIVRDCFVEQRFQLWQSVADSRPNEIVINAEIEVDKLISHARHFLPGNGGIALFDRVRNVFRGFADYFKFPNHRARGLVVVLESLRFQPGANSSMLSIAFRMSVRYSL